MLYPSEAEVWARHAGYVFAATHKQDESPAAVPTHTSSIHDAHELRLDTGTICAGLLHDWWRPLMPPMAEIKGCRERGRRRGGRGDQRCPGFPSSTREEAQAENIRR